MNTNALIADGSPVFVVAGTAKDTASAALACRTYGLGGSEPLTDEHAETALNDLLQFAKDESRVCPMPIPWDTLWKMLPGCPKYAGQSEPHAPLILAGWKYSSDADKAERLAYHIRWAHEHGALAAVNPYPRSLSVDA